MPSKFKNLVRARMAKTGESWEAAERAVREKAAHIARTPAEISVEGASRMAVDPDCLGENHCPLRYWNGEGEPPRCECLGIDISLPLLDGDDHDGRLAG